MEHSVPRDSKNVSPTIGSYPEDELGRVIERCYTDALVKGGCGLGIGLLTSILLLKRRAWPIFIGTGYGLGYAYKSCEKNMNAATACNMDCRKK